MALGIKRSTVLTVVALFTVLLPSQPGFGKERSGFKAPLVAEIAFQYAASGQSEAAAKILDQALSIAETTQSDCYKATPLMRVANGYQLIGQTSKGQQLLTRAFEIARAQTIANCTLSATSPEESLLNRAVEYAQSGYYDFALQIIRGVNNYFRPIAMVRIAEVYQADQKLDQRRQILDEAIAIAQRNPDPRSRRMLLMGIAFQLKRSGIVVKGSRNGIKAQADDDPLINLAPQFVLELGSSSALRRVRRRSPIICELFFMMFCGNKQPKLSRIR